MISYYENKGAQMKNYHYVYEILYTTNKKYIGSRSCKCLPKDDTKYLGSSKYTPNDSVLKKTILKVFKTRDKALAYESYLHKKYNVSLSKEYYNMSIQTSTKFSTYGLTKDSCDWLRIRSEKYKAYRGENRTEKQKEGARKMALTNLGVKNPKKGRSGTESNRFKPWYTKDPSGKIIEYTNITISEFLNTSHNTPFTRSSIFYATSEKEHMLLTSGNAKGWTVGFLPVPISNNIVCLDNVSTKPWWYQEPGKPKVTVNYSQDVFCEVYNHLGLERYTIKRGLTSGKPIAKYKFKGWMFGYV